MADAPRASGAHDVGSLSSDDGGGVALFRIAAMVMIFLVKIGFGHAPLYFRTNMRFLSLANAFAAGVFLAGGIAHLLPEAIEAAVALEDAEGGEHDHDHGHGHTHCHMPSTPFVLSAAGFMLTFYIEKVLLAASHERVKQHSHSPEDVAGDEEVGVQVTYHGHSHGHETSLIQRFAGGGAGGSGAEASVMPVILTAILSAHSVISGMALGIQGETSKAFLVFLAIISHKWVEAFSLGTNIIKATHANTRVLLRLLSAFAVSSPFGILLGWAMRSALAGGTAGTLTAYLDAMASGTFIYIAVVDTLTEEFANGLDVQRKYVAVIVGFATMHALGSLVAHHH